MINLDNVTITSENNQGFLHIETESIHIKIQISEDVKAELSEAMKRDLKTRVNILEHALRTMLTAVEFEPELTIAALVQDKYLYDVAIPRAKKALRV